MRGPCPRGEGGEGGPAGHRRRPVALTPVSHTSLPFGEAKLTAFLPFWVARCSAQACLRGVRKKLVQAGQDPAGPERDTPAELREVGTDPSGAASPLSACRLH